MGFAGIGMLFSAASSGLSMLGQISGGDTAARVAQYNAQANNQAAQYNNQLAQTEAANVEQTNSQNVIRERVNQRAAMGQLQAQIANSGVQGGSGSALDLQGRQASNYQLQIDDATRQASMQAASDRQAGAMGLWRANAAGQIGVWQGQQQQEAGMIGALGTGLGGIGNAVSAYGHNKFTGGIGAGGLFSGGF